MNLNDAVRKLARALSAGNASNRRSLAINSGPCTEALVLCEETEDFLNRVVLAHGLKGAALRSGRPPSAETADRRHNPKMASVRFDAVPAIWILRKAVLNDAVLIDRVMTPASGGPLRMNARTVN